MRRNRGKIESFALGLIALAGAAAGVAARTDVESLPTPALSGAMAPQLSPGQNGILLSWIEPAPGGDEPPPQSPDGSKERPLRLQMSRWDGTAWSDPGTIAASASFFANWADVPSVIEAPDGSLLAHWLQKSGPQTDAYDIQLARSTDSGRTWTPLGALNDDQTQTEHGFASLIPGPQGVHAFWLDGRETGGAGHGGPEGDHAAAAGAMTLRTALIGPRIGPGLSIDSMVCDCCPTAAAMTSRGPIVVYRDRAMDELRDISIIRAGAEGWTRPRPVSVDGWKINACPVNGPAAAARGSRLAVAWYTGTRPGPLVRVAFSDDDGETFGPAWVIDGPTALGDPLGRVGVVLDDDDTAIVLWLDGEQGRAAVRLIRAAPCGMLGSAVTIGYTEASRSSGVPRVVKHGEWVYVAWIAPGSHLKISRVRAVEIPAVSYQTWR